MGVSRIDSICAKFDLIVLSLRINSIVVKIDSICVTFDPIVLRIDSVKKST